MLKVDIPLDHSEERHYIINVLLGDFLGLSYSIVPDAKGVLSSTIITLENGNILEIADGFFCKLGKTGENYLQEKNIPKDVFFYNSENLPEKNIVGLFGKPNVVFTKSHIVCKVDIFASAFFMLTRWEEYVIKDRDLYGRFPEKLSLAFEHKFLSRPIVNEYIECIWQWLKQLGIKQTRKIRHFKFYNTHDIDMICLFEKKHHYIAKVAKAFLVEKSIVSLLHHTKLALLSIAGKDPYLAFDYFMDISERHGIKSHFFFMATNKKTDHDNGYKISSKAVKMIIKNISNRGHIIGIHPSYYTLNNPNLLSTEIKQMKKVSGSEVKCGRQHYLRFEIPHTWQHWEDNHMQWDSSLAYSQQEGFRCGVCYSFPVFNILSKKTLMLRERPLTLMDVTLITSGDGRSPEEAKKIINYYIDKTKQYSGDFVFLWHNSSFEYLIWKNYRQVFEEAFLSIRETQ